MTRKTLAELTELVGGRLKGDPATVITGIAGVREAQAGQITFAANVRYQEWLQKTRASAAVVKPDIDMPDGMPAIVVERPEAAFEKITRCFAPEPIEYEEGIHPTAVIAESVKLGVDVSVGAHAVIAPDVVVGDRTVIRPLVYVGHEVEIGSDCLIYPNVTIRERVRIGDRCILHAGVVLGSDGFGYQRAADGSQEKIMQTGTVVLEDDVEVGACSCIDRARFDRTLVKSGTKIDNFVQIAHNCVIGRNAILVSQVGLCGSAHIGAGSVLAGKASVNGHVTLGDNVMVGGLAGVTRDVPDGMRVSGFPAQDHAQELRLMAHIQRLPELVERIKKLEKRIRELEHTTDDDC